MSFALGAFVLAAFFAAALTGMRAAVAIVAASTTDEIKRTDGCRML
jgi:hypothetical protein